MKALKVRQKVSQIGLVEHTREVLRGLGLRGIGSEVVVANTPSFRGMVKKVLHLVTVEECDAGSSQKSPSPKSPAQPKAAKR